jgi:flagellar protein FliT
MSSLALLKEMSQYSHQMVDAARANDWDRLSRLERQVASLRDRLGVEDALHLPNRHRRLSDDERQQRVKLINRILDDDREVRVHTQPWLENVRQLLTGRSSRPVAQDD